jgi:hypothetical protein
MPKVENNVFGALFLQFFEFALYLSDRITRQRFHLHIAHLIGHQFTRYGRVLNRGPRQRDLYRFRVLRP